MSIFDISKKEHYAGMGDIAKGVAKRGVGGIFKSGQKAAQEAAQKAAQKAAQESAQKAAREAAQKAAQEAAQKAAREAAEKASREAAEKASKQAAEKAAREAAEKAAREAAEKASKESAEKASKQTAEKASKQAAEKASKEAAEKTKKTVQEMLNNSYETMLKKIKDNPMTSGLIIAGTLTVGGLLIDSKLKSEQINKATYNIVSIEDASTSSKKLAQISFAPGQTVTIKDTVSFTDTNSDPALPSINCEVYKIISDSQILVVIPSKIIKNGTSGNMKIHTTPDNQFKQTLKETSQDAGEILGATTSGLISGAGGAVGDVAKATGGAAGDIFSGLWDGLGLPNFKDYWWILIIILILCISSSAAPILLQIINS